MSTTTTEGQPVASSPAPVAPVVGIADPAPLGLAAFAMTTLLLSLANTTTWPAGAISAVALAFAYGGAVQLLAGMWEFKRGNTFGATAFSSRTARSGCPSGTSRRIRRSRPLRLQSSSARSSWAGRSSRPT